MKFRIPDIGRIINLKSSTNTDRVPCSTGGITDDKGNAPFVFDFEEISELNRAYRRVIWTGKHMQIALMSIPVGEEIGWETHGGGDQLIIIKDGVGEIFLGGTEASPAVRKTADEGSGIIIPEGTLHNIRNSGREPLKLISVYAPPEHPYGAVSETRDNR